jgi:hypothetical protein
VLENDKEQKTTAEAGGEYLDIPTFLRRKAD